MVEKNNIEQEIDLLFKNTLNNAEVPAPNGLWNQIAPNITSTLQPHSESLPNSGANLFSGISTLGKIVVLASTAAITAIGVYLANKPTQKSTPIHQPNVKQSESIINEDNSLNQSNTNDKSNLLSINNNKELYNSTKRDPILNENKIEAPTYITKTDVSKFENKNIYKEEKNIPIPTNPNIKIIEPENNYNQSQNVSHNDYILLSDTIICLLSDKEEINIFNKSIAKRIEYYDGEKQYDRLPMGLKNKWLIAQIETNSGDKLKRRYYLSSSTISIEISNNGKHSIFCEILNSNELSNIKWYINNELINEDLKQIVYYRNMEFNMGTPINLLVNATDQKGCPVFYSNEISEYFENNQEFMIPTVITPNHDGLNDKWIIDINGAVLFNVKVMGTNNSIIFQTNDMNHYWDGNDMLGNAVPAGAYIYILNYQLPNQKNIITKTGIIQVIRN
ncbi:MAG: gliding motility-associated C-terminal domain-containing protein [Bacteroidetes bacterium]|nr:gliding motility-associated C-terminal domain-containing protein [Bacteroidota bacterium]